MTKTERVQIDIIVLDNAIQYDTSNRQHGIIPIFKNVVATIELLVAMLQLERWQCDINTIWS